MSNERPSLAIDFNGFIEAAQALKDKPTLESKIAELESKVTYLQANNDATHSAYQALTDQHGEKISRIKELEAALADATFRERQVRDQLSTVQQAVSSLVNTIIPPTPEPAPVPTGTGVEPVAVKPESSDIYSSPKHDDFLDDDFLEDVPSPKPVTSDDDEDRLAAAIKEWEAKQSPAPFEHSAAPTPTANVQGSGTAVSSDRSPFPASAPADRPATTAPSMSGLAQPDGSYEIGRSDPSSTLKKEFVAGYCVNRDGSTTPFTQESPPIPLSMSMLIGAPATTERENGFAAPKSEPTSAVAAGQSETPFASSTDAPSSPAAYPFSLESPVEPSTVASNPCESPATVGDHMTLEDWIKREQSSR